MRRKVFPRILWFLLLTCIAFISLVTLQFTRRGNFSQRIDGMQINGRYVLDAYPEAAAQNDDLKPLFGGVTVFFGGLEFRLGFPAESDMGFSVFDANGEQQPVFPEYVIFNESEAVFTVSGGMELSFASVTSPTAEQPELRINGKFSDDVTALYIPFRIQRSSVVRDSNNDMLSISYNGNQYQFSRSLQGMEDGQLILSAAAPSISYRTVSAEKEINPADFILPQAETAQAYAEALSRWIARNFALWSNMGQQTDEDMVIAWCGEAVRQDRYSAAVATIPVSFSSSPLRTWESAVYQFDRRIGVWGNAVRAVSDLEREKSAAITRLLAERDNRLFLERNLVEYLAIRRLNQLTDNLTSYAQEIDPGSITLALSPGIMECAVDMVIWHPQNSNPFNELVEHVCRLITGGIRSTGDQVFVFDDGLANTELNLRLGKALNAWGEQSGNQEWAGLGRSLVLSVFAIAAEDGSVPSSFPFDSESDVRVSGGRLSAAKQYRLLNNSVYLPNAMATGSSNIWAYSAAASVNITQNERQMDIAIRFPVGETHYVMLRNVRPFALLQIYDGNWRMASDFESYYNASGWYYFSNEQTLVLKIRHRTNVENIRIIFTAPTPPPPPPPPSPPPPPPPAAGERE